MYFQRAGVAVSPVIHLIPTSSLSIELNSPNLLGSIGCTLRHLLQKEAIMILFIRFKRQYS